MQLGKARIEVGDHLFGAFRFAENMEALKHNFLFKPYFEERGYLATYPAIRVALLIQL